MNVYDFNVKDAKGGEVSLKEYEGKVLLIVNTATKCGLTPQYKELQSLYDEFKGKGFELLDFPCNQFLSQAPGTVEEITQFCTLNYGTTFRRFGKVSVNGPEADPLYKFLKQQAPEDKTDKASGDFEKIAAPLRGKTESSDIKWNFGKFLIDRNGNVVARYYPAYDLKALKAEIEKEL